LVPDSLFAKDPFLSQRNMLLLHQSGIMTIAKNIYLQF